PDRMPSYPRPHAVLPQTACPLTPDRMPSYPGPQALLRGAATWWSPESYYPRSMLKPGDTFERYTIEELLGEGGMGCVYRARDTRLGRRVALKVISAGQRDGQGDADANARLVREARAAAALDHPNAVSIFDVGEYEGAPFIVMELVSGRTLRDAIGDASVPAATYVAQLADVARALGVAHKRGLVHRDIKPEN